MNIHHLGQTICVFLLSINASIVSALTPEVDAVSVLQHEWAKANYTLKGKAKLKAFEKLIDQAEQYKREHPDSARVYIWSGIIKSTYAGAKGGLGALKYAKQSKKDLEKALAIKPDAEQGSAYTSLGVLYYNVPGWPLGFGDDEKAETMLRQALKINPDGIDPNYFYGLFLFEEGKPDEARQFLKKAQMAPTRPDRPIADKGRQQEIAMALAKIEEEQQ